MSVEGAAYQAKEKAAEGSRQCVSLSGLAPTNFVLCALLGDCPPMEYPGGIYLYWGKKIRQRSAAVSIVDVPSDCPRGRDGHAPGSASVDVEKACRPSLLSGIGR